MKRGASTEAVNERIQALALGGFGGACGRAAVEINERVFGGKGRYVAGLNEFWLNRDHAIGHVAVLWDGRYWDAKGILSEEDLLDWGVLNTKDPAYAHREFGEREAEHAILVEFDDAVEVLKHFPWCALP